MQTSRFTREFIYRMCSGPIIWAVHFVVIYSLAGIFCARPAWRREWMGIGILDWSVGIASVLAIAAIALIHPTMLRLRQHPTGESYGKWIGVLLAMLSIVAILWETLPVFFLPECD